MIFQNLETDNRTNYLITFWEYSPKLQFHKEQMELVWLNEKGSYMFLIVPRDIKNVIITL
jgi:hypothetical protein